MEDKKDPLEVYAKDKWHGRPNYQCPKCPKYSTINSTTFRAHMRAHEKSAKPKLKRPAGKISPAAPKPKGKGGKK